MSRLTILFSFIVLYGLFIYLTQRFSGFDIIFAGWCAYFVVRRFLVDDTS